MNTKQWIWMAFILVLLSGCKGDANKQTEAITPTPVESGPPTATPARTGLTVLADGLVQPAQPMLPLAFEASGRLSAVHVSPGDHVQQGELLAELEEAEPLDSYLAAVTSAELAVLRSQQELDDLYANAEFARTEALNDITTYAQAVRDAQFQLENFNIPVYLQGLEVIEAFDRMKSQLDDASAAFEPYRYLESDDLGRKERLEALNDAMSQYNAAVRRLNYEYELQVAQAHLDKARADYDQYTTGPAADDLSLAQAELANAQAQLDLVRQDLQLAIEAQEDAFLRAPWTGTVLSVEAAPGALVSSGAPILTLLDNARLEFHTTNLSERDLSQIVPGQKAMVTLKAFPFDPLEASVLCIGWQVGEMVGDAATFPVVLTLGATELDIRPGMTGRAEIQSSEE